jgi:integrase
MRARLTDVLVRGLKPVAGSQVKVWDTSTGGFGVLVNERSKSWIVMYGRKRTMKVIGHYPVVSLAEARLAAKKILVAPPPVAAPPSRPFIEVRDQFLETHAANLRPQSRYQLSRIIRRYFVWNKPLDQITYDDVATVIEGIKAKSEAAHALTDIKTFFNWCVPRFIPHSPCQGIKPPKRYTPRSRYLSDEELKAVWVAAEAMGFQYGKFCQLLITTGQRRNQISSLRWSWIDQKKKCIKFPAEVMKGGRDHWVPYSDLTASILATIPKMGDLLFPARGKDKPATNQGKIKQTLDTLAGVSGYTIHDLRRTMAVGLQKCRVSVELIETLLSHRSGIFGGIVGVYQRHDFKDEMREAIEKWESRLLTLL